MTGWSDYDTLIRDMEQLADARANAAVAQDRDAKSARVACEALTRRAAAQREQLQWLGQILGRSMPEPSVVTSTAVPTAPTLTAPALTAAARHLDAADIRLANAQLQTTRPSFLPGASRRTRNALLYLICSTLATLVLYATLLVAGSAASSITLLGWLCTGVPVMAWVGGFIAIGAWGRPRIGNRSESRSPATGFAICVIVISIAYCAFKALSYL